MSSTQRVFNIPELLENVLLYIPERDLLSQRVNQTFQNTIIHSLRLQRKLFYTADLYHQGDVLSKLVWNPLLDVFRPWNSSSLARVTWEDWRNLNENNQLSVEDFMNACTPNIDLEALGRANYPTASWKKMYFTQPSVSTMAMDRKFPAFRKHEGQGWEQKHTDSRSNVTVTHYQKGEVWCVWESILRLR